MTLTFLKKWRKETMAKFQYSFRADDAASTSQLPSLEFQVAARPANGSNDDVQSLRDERSQKVGMFIVHFWRGHRYGPTIREIQHATGIQSLSTVKEAVDVLRDAGYVTYVPKQARTLVPSDKLLEQV